VLVTIIILVLGLVIFFSCVKVIENPHGYGVGTLDEKSTRPAPEQLKRVSQITYFTKAHAILLPAVDCGMNTDNDSRAIAEELVGAMSYTVELANDNNHRWVSQFYLPRQFLDDTLYSAVTFKGMTDCNVSHSGV